VGTTISLSRSKYDNTQQAFASSASLNGAQALGSQLHNIFGPIYNPDGNYAMITAGDDAFNVGPGTGYNNNYGYVTEITTVITVL